MQRKFVGALHLGCGALRDDCHKVARTTFHAGAVDRAIVADVKNR